MAGPPSSITYQGSLSDADGHPVDASVGMVFSLYDQPSGGTVLWSETETVTVSEGLFQVELGDVVAIPARLFNRQLYLGITVGTDSEMVPRPKLTAAPVAIRSLQSFTRTVQVPADGSASENGQALLDAVAALPATSETERYAIALDAGIYDLGSQRVVLPPFVSLRGQSRTATEVRGSFGNGTVGLSNDTEVSHLTVRNTGQSSDPEHRNFAVGSATEDDTSRIRISHVNAYSVFPSDSTTLYRTGVRLVCVHDSVFESIHAEAEGGQYNYGFYLQGQNSDIRVRDVSAIGRDAVLGGRGIDLTGLNLSVNDIEGIAEKVNVGGGDLRAVRIFEYNNGATNGGSGVFDGIRARVRFAPGLMAGASTNTFGLVVDRRGGFVLRNVDVDVVADSAGAHVEGIYLGAEAGDVPFELSELTVRMHTGPNTEWSKGISSRGAAPRIRNADVRMNCEAVGASSCVAYLQGTYVDPNVPIEGTTDIRDSSFQVANSDPDAHTMPWVSVGLSLHGNARLVNVQASSNAGFPLLASVLPAGAPASAVQVERSTFISASAISSAHTADSTGRFLHVHFEGGVPDVTGSTCVGSTHGNAMLSSSCN